MNSAVLRSAAAAGLTGLLLMMCMQASCAGSRAQPGDRVIAPDPQPLSSVTLRENHQQVIDPADQLPADPPTQDARPSIIPPAMGERVIIHPLTRVGVDSAGLPALILHLELRDKFDQTVKSLGIVRAELTSADDRVAMTWTADLLDPRTNAQMFDDAVTRTYTLPLGGVPDWLIAWSQGDSSPQAGTAGPSLRVVFTTPAISARPLRATARLQR